MKEKHKNNNIIRTFIINIISLSFKTLFSIVHSLLLIIMLIADEIFLDIQNYQ